MKNFFSGLGKKIEKALEPPKPIPYMEQNFE